MIGHAARAFAMVVAGAAATACLPRLHPAPGIEVRRALPPATMAAGSRLVVMDWAIQDADIEARGDAAARLVAPDSARLDFFLAAGMGRGAVILVEDSLSFPASADDFGRRFVPSAPLLWAALGRFAVPPAADTAIHVNVDTLRADIGRPVNWRVTFIRDSLWRLERVSRNRVVEWVQRDGAVVRYRSTRGRRQLDLRITRTESVSAFDPSIWSFP